MNISKIKVGSTTYNLKDSSAISLNTISSWAQAGNSDTIPSSKLPSYVDDVLEYASTSSFPETGESGKIYVATDTNKTYRWGGSSYIVISETLAVGTTEGTAYDGAAGAALKSKLDGIEAGAQTHRAPSAAEVKTALGTGSGTTKYLREDGTWATPPDTNTWPTATSQLTNDSGYITGITKTMVTTALGYTPPTTDTNTVTSINGKTGAIAAADMAAVLTAAGYALTDTNTWPSYTSQLTNDSGYITSSGSCNYANSAGSAGSATSAGYANQLQAFTGDNFTGGDHFVKAIRSSDGWSTRLWMCYNGGAAQSNAVQVSYADSAGYAGSAGSAPASDVYSWAKQSSKPSYSYSEISGRPTKLSDLTNDVGYITSYTDTNTWRGITDSYSGTDSATSLSLKGGNALYNALVNGYASSAGTASYLSGFENNNSSEKNANDVTYNAHTYYTSNGPSTSIGASTDDGALYSQAYSASWVGQIAQDYRNGGLYVRGRNNGAWQSWYRVWDSRSLTNLNQLSNGPGYITGITKAMVTNALGYTPPTSDTNTWRPLGTGANDACAGNDSRLSNSRPASDVYSWAKASSKPSYSWSEIGSRPTALSQFTNDSGYITSSGSCNYATTAGSAPASDVYSWAKASSKPGYSYGEISNAVNSVTTSGAISLAGTTPLHIVTLNGNASSVALSSNPATGHSCHVIFYSTTSRTVAIAHNATARVCPNATDVSLTVPANGYVEVDFLFDGTKTWVRGV